MTARGKARKRALDILFEAEMQREPLLDVLEDRIERAEPPVTAYAAELVRGVAAHRAEIDGLLAANAKGWTLDRMPAVDRNILRIGAFELLWGTQVPDAVAISEAVLLATDLSTDASPGFVNGLLARLLEIKPTLAGEPDCQRPGLQSCRGSIYPGGRPPRAGGGCSAPFGRLTDGRSIYPGGRPPGAPRHGLSHLAC